MMVWNALRLALREIRRNVLRSSLTILGIVIGVAAVIVMVTIGGGATVQVTQQIASLGSNLLMVRPGQLRHGPSASTNVRLFDLADAEATGAGYPPAGRGRAVLVAARDGNLRQYQLGHLGYRHHQRVFPGARLDGAARAGIHRGRAARRQGGVHHRGHRAPGTLWPAGPAGEQDPPAHALLRGRLACCRRRVRPPWVPTRTISSSCPCAPSSDASPATRTSA